MNKTLRSTVSVSKARNNLSDMYLCVYFPFNLFNNCIFIEKLLPNSIHVTREF